MGKKLLRYYDYLEEKLGREGKVRLAQATHIPSVLADAAEDSEENLRVFREAILKITGHPAPD